MLHADGYSNIPASPGPPPPLSILLITAPRSSPTGYLLRVLAELHRQGQGALPLTVCNVDTTGSHPEYAGIAHMFHTIHADQNQTKHHTVRGKARQKEKSDFVGCVTRLLAEASHGSDLLLVLEDDALIVEEFFPTLSSILLFHLPSYQQKDWLDVKLYTPPKWSGFGLDILPILDLIAYSGLIAVAYVSIAKMTSR